MKRRSIIIIGFSLLVFAVLPLFSLAGNTQAEDMRLQVRMHPSFTMTVWDDLAEIDVSDYPNQLIGNTVGVGITTNVNAGYSLVATASSTSIMRTTLLPNGERPGIPTIDNIYTNSDSFPSGHWGLALENPAEYYRPFETNMLISSSDGPADRTDYITFYAKGDPTLDPGYYELDISLTGVANIVSYTMQDQTADSIDELLSSVGDVEYLDDTRDGNRYAVGKLIDGNVWMLDNLRLGDTGQSITLTSGDTNVTTDYVLSNYVVVDDGEDEASLDDPHIITSHASDLLSYGSGSGKKGAYYNYCAVTAGQFCGYDETEWFSDATTMHYHITHDICPKGWRLPTNNEIRTLVSAYRNIDSLNVVQLVKNTLRFPLAGYNWGRDEWDMYVSGVDMEGFLWSSDYYANLGAKGLYISDYNSNHYIGEGFVWNDYGAGQFAGASAYATVRCIFGESEYEDTWAETVNSGVDPCAAWGECYDPCDDDPDNC